MDPGAILVTGASGFVGRHLIDALRAAFPAARLIPTSRREGVTVAGLEATALDLHEPARIRSTLAALNPSVIVHLGGEADVGRAIAEPLATWHSNFWRTLEFAEIVRRDFPDTLFLFISSGDTYGLTFRSRDIVTELHPLAPANPYSATKAAADLAIGEMALRGLRAIRLRPFNHTGPRQSANFVIPALARQIARIEAGFQEPLIQTGTLDTARDFLDIRDVCSAYVGAIRESRNIESGAVFNVSSGAARRIGDVLQRLLDIAEIDVRIEADSSRMRANDIKVVCGDPSKARARLNWEPKVDFDRTLSDTLDWWRGQVGDVETQAAVR